jgi:PhzF family phenazine biosynthesis protein
MQHHLLSSIMDIAFYFLDTFTSEKFRGNPTPVCYLTGKVEDDILLLSLAKEFNQPVTAFVNKLADQTYNIRYFTTVTEIPACGHATLAAAAVVSKKDSVNNISFKTQNNLLIHVLVEGDLISMSYPKYNMTPAEVSDETVKSLGIKRFVAAGICHELETLFIELHSPEELEGVKPDFKKLVESNDQVKEIVITCQSGDDQYDYLLRSFCPWIGIDEDPVTGSVHSALAPYWCNQLKKQKLMAYQVSGRGGQFGIYVQENAVQISGETLLVIKGELTIPI